MHVSDSGVVRLMHGWDLDGMRVAFLDRQENRRIWRGDTDTSGRRTNLEILEICNKLL
jgi:hypothetical protein